MLFTSIEFLFRFLPIVVVGYFLLPFRYGLKNIWLLAASLFFYAWGEPRFVVVLLISIVVNYALALVIDHVRGRRRLARAALVVGVVVNLGLIGVYKYANFVTSVVRECFPFLQGAIPQTSILLPIGISFFTFQAISYLIDVSRGVHAQRNPFSLALYIALFPQLIAGPIVRYNSIREQIDGRHTTWEMFSTGVLRFVLGFNKKLLLANALGVVADRAFEAGGGLTCAMAWLGAVSYTLQIYFDFSGYSDMAIGLGRIFGFTIAENFDHPYISSSISEFWRRWHISLGSWFRDYVYIPLGGSRVDRLRLILNLAVVWALTGLWHGANWTFILWGCLYGALIIMEKLSGRGMGRFATMFITIFGFVLFRSESITAAVGYMRTMLGGGAFFDGDALFWLRESSIILPAAILCCLPVAHFFRRRAFACVGYGASCLLFLISISQLVMNVHNPFIYFNF